MKSSIIIHPGSELYILSLLFDTGAGISSETVAAADTAFRVHQIESYGSRLDHVVLVRLYFIVLTLGKHFN